MKPPQRAPIRVERKGWRRHFHPTLQELEDAVRFTENEAKHWRWVNIEALTDYFGTSINKQLGVGIRVDIDAHHIDTEASLLAVWTQKIGPAYATIAMSQIGEKPNSEFEAGARAVAHAVAKVAKDVKGHMEAIGITPKPDSELMLTRFVDRDLDPVGTPTGQPPKRQQPVAESHKPAERVSVQTAPQRQTAPKPSQATQPAAGKPAKTYQAFAEPPTKPVPPEHPAAQGPRPKARRP
jgi:hypothetical protein